MCASRRPTAGDGETGKNVNDRRDVPDEMCGRGDPDADPTGVAVRAAQQLACGVRGCRVGRAEGPQTTGAIRLAISPALTS